MLTGDLCQANKPDEPKVKDVYNVKTKIVVHLPEEADFDHFFGYVVRKFQAKYPELGHVLEKKNVA